MAKRPTLRTREPSEKAKEAAENAKARALWDYCKDAVDAGHEILVRDDSGNNWYLDIERASCPDDFDGKLRQAGAEGTEARARARAN